MSNKKRVEQHVALAKGDIVKIKGESGAKFVVMWIDEFEDVERPAEVTVVGGSSGRKAWRTFEASKATKQKKGTIR